MAASPTRATIASHSSSSHSPTNVIAEPSLPAARRAPHAVDVLFGVLGYVVVDDVCDVGDIEPARGHVGRHEPFELAAAEVAHHAVALALAQVAVDGAYVDAVAP